MVEVKICCSMVGISFVSIVTNDFPAGSTFLSLKNDDINEMINAVIVLAS